MVFIKKAAEAAKIGFLELNSTTFLLLKIIEIMRRNNIYSIMSESLRRN